MNLRIKLLCFWTFTRQKVSLIKKNCLNGEFYLEGIIHVNFDTNSKA